MLNNEEKFIVDLQLEPSDKKTPNYIIYWLYLNWCYKNVVKPKHNKHFFKYFKPLFKSQVSSGDRYYYVTCDAIENLTKEEKKLAIYDRIKQTNQEKVSSRRY